VKKKGEESTELMKEIWNVCDKLESGGLSDGEVSMMKAKRKLLWNRFYSLKRSGQNTDSPRYLTRSETTPDIILQLSPLPPALETDDSNKNARNSVSKDFPK
jgi:hypothetical protein